MHDRFFESPRGKIVGALRECRFASAFDLARRFGLSANAIRQQLVALERDGLIAGRSVRRGKTKPTVEYSLTPEAGRYFPQRYDRMLNAVLREIRDAGGSAAVAALFDRIGHRSAERLASGDADRPAEDRITQLVAGLQASGVSAEVTKTDVDMVVLHEHTCPYATVVAEHPEACGAIHTILDTIAPGNVRHVESLATGGAECRFEIALADRGQPPTTQPQLAADRAPNHRDLSSPSLRGRTGGPTQRVGGAQPGAERL